VSRFLAKWALLAGIPALSIHAHAWSIAFLAVVTDLALYSWSLWRRPWVPCRLCSGSGTSKGIGLVQWLWPNAFGGCVLCKGKKGFVRLGVRVLTPGRVDKVKRGQ
jgi:hypothetical protein